MQITIGNGMAAEAFEAMQQRVIQMSTGIDEFVYNEMLNHKMSYDPATGKRFTSFESSGDNGYSVISVITGDGVPVNLEFIKPVSGNDDALVLYIHGAAYIRRSNDINLKTADRLCTMTNQIVCVPDYRIGKDYSYDQMIADVIATYHFLITTGGYDSQKITFLADSSGCVTTMQSIREFAKFDLPAPGKIVLWSPMADEKSDEARFVEGKYRDISFRSNNLFKVGVSTYHKDMCKGKKVEDVYPVYGDYSNLKNTRIMIQAGAEEILREDAERLYEVFIKSCPCALEMYEGMFHNFQTYFSVCEMAKVCWNRTVEFITNA